jgi:hypothetical protein
MTNMQGASPRLYLAVALFLSGAAAGFVIFGKDKPLVADLPSEPSELASAWNDRLIGAFPDGTRREKLVDALREANFRITEKDGGGSATYLRQPFFAKCTGLLVNWSATETVVSNVSGTILLC